MELVPIVVNAHKAGKSVGDIATELGVAKASLQARLTEVRGMGVELPKFTTGGGQRGPNREARDKAALAEAKALLAQLQG